jgi:hypothetical protein
MESKRLLREAMRGLLPDSVLAPRSEKTGLTVGYFERRFHRDLRRSVARLAGEDLRLADLGVVEPTAFLQAVARYLANRDSAMGLPLYLTLQTEFWLRSRQGLAGASA